MINLEAFSNKRLGLCAGCQPSCTFPVSQGRLPVHEPGEARHDHHYLLRGWQTRLGECLSVLYFQIWLDRLHPSPRC